MYVLFMLSSFFESFHFLIIYPIFPTVFCFKALFTPIEGLCCTYLMSDTILTFTYISRGGGRTKNKQIGKDKLRLLLFCLLKD